MSVLHAIDLLLARRRLAERAAPAASSREPIESRSDGTRVFQINSMDSLRRFLSGGMA